MTIKIIPVNENNVIEWRKSVRRVFGDIPSKSDVERMLAGRFAKNTSWEKRLIAALDDETSKIVGTGGADEFKITAKYYDFSSKEIKKFIKKIFII